MTFVVIHIFKTNDGLYMIQDSYEINIGPFLSCSSFDDFRSLLHKQAWLGHTWPDIISPVNIMFEVNENTYEARHIRVTNGILKRVKTDEGRSIRQHTLDIKYYG